MSKNPWQCVHDAPRCKAKSKRTRKPCRAPAVRSYRVCRMHGAPRWRARGEKERQFHAGGRTKETTYASRYINQLARLLHVTTKAPMRRTRQRHAAVLNMRSVTKV